MGNFRGIQAGFLIVLFAGMAVAPSYGAASSLVWADSGYVRVAGDPDLDDIDNEIDHTHRIGRYDPATGDAYTIRLTGAGTRPVAIKVDSQFGHLYWFDSAHGMFRSNRDGNDVVQLLGDSPSDNFTGISNGMALDGVHRNIYWADRGTIYRYDIQNPGISEVFFQGIHVHDLAVDATGEYLYWGVVHGSEPNRIGRIRLATMEVETLVQFDAQHDKDLYGLAIDDKHGKLYWSMQGVGIMRSNLDGSEVQVINDSVIFTQSIAIDADANALYWTNFFSISKSDLDGGNVQILVSGTIGEDSPIFFVNSLALDPNPIPLPGAAWAGLGLLGALAARRSRGDRGRINSFV